APRRLHRLPELPPSTARPRRDRWPRRNRTGRRDARRGERGAPLRRGRAGDRLLGELGREPGPLEEGAGLRHRLGRSGDERATRHPRGSAALGGAKGGSHERVGDEPGSGEDRAGARLRCFPTLRSGLHAPGVGARRVRRGAVHRGHGAGGPAHGRRVRVRPRRSLAAAHRAADGLRGVGLARGPGPVRFLGGSGGASRVVGGGPPRGGRRRGAAARGSGDGRGSKDVLLFLHRLSGRGARGGGFEEVSGGGRFPGLRTLWKGERM
ncbi:MAG: Chorismate dehydratase, partial [uncultured Rubrobacteraceae bacterium]